MPTRYFRTLISKTDLQKLKSYLKQELTKPINKDRENKLLATKKHYFLETESAENLKELLLVFDFVECSKPKEKMDRI